MVSLHVEEDKAHQKKQSHNRHDRHDHHADAAKALKDEVIEQNIIKMQNQNLVNRVKLLLTRRLKALGVTSEELQEVEDQEKEREREEKIKRGQEDPDNPTEKTQDEIDQENLTMLEDQSISDEIVNPPIVRFQGRLLTSDEVATAAVMQFNGGQYEREPYLMKIPYVPGLGRAGIACEIIRTLVFNYMVQAMRRKFAPDELEEMWYMVMETGIILPEVCKIADDAIKYMVDKLSPEEMALTTPSKLAMMIVKAMKEAYCQSKEVEKGIEKRNGVHFEDDEDAVSGISNISRV